jgi:hypothetical protein
MPDVRAAAPEPSRSSVCGVGSGGRSCDPPSPPASCVCALGTILPARTDIPHGVIALVTSNMRSVFRLARAASVLSICTIVCAACGGDDGALQGTHGPAATEAYVILREEPKATDALGFDDGKIVVSSSGFAERMTIRTSRPISPDLPGSPRDLAGREIGLTGGFGAPELVVVSYFIADGQLVTIQIEGFDEQVVTEVIGALEPATRDEWTTWMSQR